VNYATGTPPLYNVKPVVSPVYTNVTSSLVAPPSTATGTPRIVIVCEILPSG